MSITKALLPLSTSLSEAYRMKIVITNEVDVIDRTLRSAWDDVDSFCLVSRATDAQVKLSSLIDIVPDEFRSNHFGILSSGSAGKPRLFIGNKKKAEALARLIHDAQSCESVRETVCLLPLNYSFSFVNQWLWSRVNRRRFVTTPGMSNPESVQRALASSYDSMVCLVGSQLPLLEKAFGDTEFPGIVRVNFAGERFPQTDLSYVRRLFPNSQIFNNYGCTEAMPRLSIRAAEASEDAANIGFPLPGIELKTASDGQLRFRSPYSAVASVGHDGIERFSDNQWIDTGDVGEQTPDGTWRVSGRTNAVFKRFGEKVAIASIIEQFKSVWSGSIVGYPDLDANGDQTWVAIVSPKCESVEVRKLLLLLRQNFTRPHWPIRIESMDSLPHLPNGKIDIQALKDAENKKLHWRQRI